MANQQEFAKRGAELLVVVPGPSDRLGEFLQRAKNQTLKSAYERLRSSAKKHVELAVPRISRLVAKYTAAAPTVASPTV